MPRFAKLAARLQNLVSRRREEVGLYREIAEYLPLRERSRLLDVGTGSGLQLRVIHQLAPSVELFGLDLSAAAIQIACANLAEIPVDLRCGNIQQTPYDDDFFDIVTCNASMSYWRNPVMCFDEIHRILKPGGCAMLFEPQKDVDIDAVVATLKSNLADKSPVRRFMAVSLNKFGFRWGSKLGLKLYGMDELEAFANQSRFKNAAMVERITLQNLPVFVKITLTKV